jgi:prolipoprotein diacylglyceryl transferase
MVIASIPSPSFNSIDIGPLSLNIYGLCIALGVVAAVWLFGRRLEERGVGTRDDASAIGVVAVLAGVIGARLYHVVTDWDRFDDNLAAIPKIWEGGLGIPGGLLFGIPVGLWMGKRHGISIAMTATCAAPAIPLAQAIGRWGNYFNQELYGRSTDLPWALEIDAEHLLPGYAVGTTFHPTFLYESLWSLGLVFVLLWIDRRFRPPDGQLMVMYLIGYGIGRFWVEGLRIDAADELGGLRWNQWVALAAVVGGFAALALWPDPSPSTLEGSGEQPDDADGETEPDDDGPDDGPDGDESGDGPADEPDHDEPDDGPADEPDHDGDEPFEADGSGGAEDARHD